MSVLVGLIVMLGMFAVVPVGLRLLDDSPPGSLRLLCRVWPLLAAPGAVSLWLPRSPLATALAGVYALGTLALALHAPARLARTRSLAPAEVAALTALATPAVAALALVAERAGHELFGFELGILALTVPHFHFAGFAAALVAGLVCRATESRATRFAAVSVPLGTLLVLLGYFVDDWAELAGALVLTAGMWAVALATWRELRPAAPDPVTRALLGVSAAVLVATMLLALSWALGEATGIPHPSLTWMAATHGLGNALGFAVCSLLAWRRLGRTGTAAEGDPAAQGRTAAAGAPAARPRTAAPAPRDRAARPRATAPARAPAARPRTPAAATATTTTATATATATTLTAPARRTEFPA